MPLDVKFLSRTADGQFVDQTYPVPDMVDGEYALVQRIVKNFKTVPGDDEQDPGWGSALFVRLFAVPAQKVDEARSVATGALQKCLRDIQTAQPSDPLLMVSDLHLSSLVYTPETSSWDVSVEVVTASGTITVPLSN